ncbi:MAG TPA: hypothetical protein VMV18_05140 [bacterium]|nr:hypothetical protein [bacterium]
MSAPRWLTLCEQNREEALRAFFLEWHGMSRVPRSFPPDVPVPLRWLHEHIGASSFARQNRLLAPGNLEVERDGKRIFYVENQGVCAWATEKGDDAPVWIRWEGTNRGWEREEESLSGFVLQIALFETIVRAGKLGMLDERAARDLESRLTRVPLAPWAWPKWPGRFFANEDVLAFVNANEGEWDAFVCAKSDERMDEFLAPWAKSFGD